MSTVPHLLRLRLVAVGVVVAAMTGACFVQSVDLDGKACDLQHSCDVGYACTDVGDGGSGMCTPEASK